MFYCDLCKCSLPDSTAWYDHINGKKHNRLKGMSMIVMKKDVETIKQKLLSLKKPILGKRLHPEIKIIEIIPNKLEEK